MITGCGLRAVRKGLDTFLLTFRIIHLTVVHLQLNWGKELSVHNFSSVLLFTHVTESFNSVTNFREKSVRTKGF